MSDDVTSTVLGIPTVDPSLHYQQVIQLLAVELANKTIEVAQLQAKCDIALAFREHVQVNTWVNSSVDTEVPEISGLTLISPEQVAALYRLLAAVDVMR